MKIKEGAWSSKRVWFWCIVEIVLQEGFKPSLTIHEISFREQELKWLFVKYTCLENNRLYGIYKAMELVIIMRIKFTVVPNYYANSHILVFFRPAYVLTEAERPNLEWSG